MRKTYRFGQTLALIAFFIISAASRLDAAPTFVEYPLLSDYSSPNGITTGPDGALWFTDVGMDSIERITTSGMITTRYQILTGLVYPQEIVLGPDGNLWYYDNNGITRITTSGVISQFPLPTSYDSVFSLTPGPDGGLWFIAQGTSPKIGRISNSGVITEYAVIGVNAVTTVGNIINGPDGALWFTTAYADEIGRITTGGVFTFYSIARGLPPGIKSPQGIASGSDGALWFTENLANKIGRITTDGILTEYQIPTANSGASEIISGPDGALWFIEHLAPEPTIGRIDISGHVTEFVAPGETGNIVSIAAGPDGNIWFTKSRPNEVGKLELNDELTVVSAGTGAGVITSDPSGITCGPTCVAAYHKGSSITLTASAAIGSVFTGWSGAGCTGTSVCTVTLSADTTVTATFSVAPPTATLSVLPTGNGTGVVSSNPAGVACGPTCNASFPAGTLVTLTGSANAGSTFVGWSGGGCGNTSTCQVALAADTTVYAIVQSTGGPVLNAAVLPESRSVVVGATATAFATILNSGPGVATGCSIIPTTPIAATFSYQMTDSTTNAPTGTVNTAADIAVGTGRSFVLAFTPTTLFAPTDVNFSFSCANANSAPSVSGLDTLLLSSSVAPVPDIVGAAATSSNDGIFDIPISGGRSSFAVATTNVGASDTISMSADAGAANIPIVIAVCQTNASGACIGSPTPSVSTVLTGNSTASFGVFVSTNATIPFLPGVNRVFVRFKDSTGTIRGQTSVAVRTQ